MSPIRIIKARWDRYFVFALRYKKRFYLNIAVILIAIVTFTFDTLWGSLFTALTVIYSIYDVWYTWREHRSFKPRKIRFDLQSLNDPLDRGGKKSLDLGEDYAFFEPEINDRLDQLRAQMRIKKDRYLIPEPLRTKYGNLFEEKRLLPDTNNEEKIRLCEDIDSNFIRRSQSEVVIQKTDYYSSLLTNEAFNLALYNTDGSILLDGRGYLLANNQLIGLGNSIASNHIGVSVMAITQDGYLLHQRQGQQEQGAHQLGPSASGSADWRDVESAMAEHAGDFFNLVRLAARRELLEETSTPPKALRVSDLRITGYARFAHRAGKPEFFCFCVLPADHDVVRKVPRNEKRRVHEICYTRVATETSRACADDLQTFLQNIKESQQVATPSLVASLVFAIQYLRQSEHPTLGARTESTVRRD